MLMSLMRGVIVDRPVHPCSLVLGKPWPGPGRSRTIMDYGAFHDRSQHSRIEVRECQNRLRYFFILSIEWPCFARNLSSCAISFFWSEMILRAIFFISASFPSLSSASDIWIAPW